MKTAGFPARLLLAGAGKMGLAMLEGWLAKGLNPQSVSIIDPKPSAELLALSARLPIQLNVTPPQRQQTEVLVLAIKPQMLEIAGPELAKFVDDRTLVLSIMAGKSIQVIASHLPKAEAIIRAMPNTPAAVGRGITGLYGNSSVNSAQKAIAQALMEAMGAAVFVESESQIDAVTAVSGSGPAYVFYMVECLMQAGLDLGLTADLAAKLARATIEGAGELMHQSPLSAQQLRVNVTSPGGTTAAALDVLMGAQGLEPLMRKAVAAAYKRAQVLAH